MFLRGITDGRATDPNGGALTAQALGDFVDDSVEAHTHTYNNTGVSAFFSAGGGGSAVVQNLTSTATQTTTTTPAGSTETTVKNEGILYCIQY
jgi:hypothetical protein